MVREILPACIETIHPQLVFQLAPTNKQPSTAAANEIVAELWHARLFYYTSSLSLPPPK